MAGPSLTSNRPQEITQESLVSGFLDLAMSPNPIDALGPSLAKGILALGGASELQREISNMLTENIFSLAV